MFSLKAQIVWMIFIFGELIAEISAWVSSSEFPSATINSSQMGNIEVIASIIG